MEILTFQTIVSGTASGECLVSAFPLSFWGGVDPETGIVQDVHSDLSGQCISGKILCIPRSKGSCSGSTVILEMIRTGVAPRAILCLEAEAIMSLGAVIGEKIYGKQLPIRSISKELFDQIKTGAKVSFTENTVTINE